MKGWDVVEIFALLRILILIARYRESRENAHLMYSSTKKAFTKHIYETTNTVNRLCAIYVYDELSTKNGGYLRDKLAPFQKNYKFINH